jgi:SGNH hydrolase-like domain, acetyltransferase AlgX
MVTSRTSSIVMWLLSITAVWIVTAWLGHGLEPWAIQLTNPAFAVSLGWTYVAAWCVAVAAAKKRRLAIVRAVAVTLSLMLCLLILEAPAAIGVLDYGRLRGWISGALSGPETWFIGDHDFSFRRPPNTRWSGRPRSDMAEVFNLPIRASHKLTFSTDSRGFRNAAVLDHADIALVGDSYIEGAYISDEETVAVRLHEFTGRTVANLGVSGYGTEQELKVIQRYALPLKPRMVAWFFFEGNDLDDDQNYDNAMLYEHRPTEAPRSSEPASVRWRKFANRSFTKNAFIQAREWSAPLIPTGIDSFGWFRSADGAANRLYFYDVYAKRIFGEFEQERLKTTKATLIQGAEIARQHGINLLVYYIPIKFRVYADLCTFPPGSPCRQWQPWDLEVRFAAFCKEAGIHFVSLTEPMRRAASAGAVLYAPEDSHWNAEGHAFVAKEVAAAWKSEVGSLENRIPTLQ